MDLPFTVEQFLDVFRDYNRAIWPAQIAAYALGVVAILLILRPTRRTNRVVGLILAAMWFWMGIVYHIAFFSEINTAAFVFGALFLVQGALFVTAALGGLELKFRLSWTWSGVTGAVLIAYALIIYPILGTALGHGYPYAPVFGVAPCPTTIFTFGLLLWTNRGVSRWLLLIPSIWAAIGFSAAISLGVREDLGLLVAAVAGVGLIFGRKRETSATIA